MPGSPSERSVHSGLSCSIFCTASASSCSKLRSSRLGGGKGIALISHEAKRKSGELCLLGRTYSVFQGQNELLRSLRVALGVYPCDLDPGLPSLQGTTRVMDGKPGCCVIVRCEH